MEPYNRMPWNSTHDGRCYWAIVGTVCLTMAMACLPRKLHLDQRSSDATPPPAASSPDTTGMSSFEAAPLTTTEMPCRTHPGRPDYVEGTGMCTGNNYLPIDLPTARITLYYNSLGTTSNRCVAPGWSLSIDRSMLSESGALAIVDGDGTSLELSALPDASAILATNPLRSVNQFFTQPEFAEVTRDGTRLTYSAVAMEHRHYLTRVEDRNGNVTAIVRDEVSQCPNSMTTPTGETIRFIYSGGKLRSITDNAKNQYLLTYANGVNLTKIVLPDGHDWTFAYQIAASLVTAANSPSGEHLEFAYSLTPVLGVLMSSTNGLNWMTKFRYTANAVTRISNTESLTESFESGRLVRTSQNGMTSSTAWDSEGRIATQVDLLGRTTNFSYSGSVTTDRSNFFPSEVASPDGLHRRFTYDDNWNVVQEGTTNGGYSSVSDYTWDEFGQLLTQSTAGKTITFERQNGNLTKVIDINGRTIYAAQFDDHGHPISYSDEFGLITRLAWADNRLISTQDHFGREVKYAYDSLGHIASTVTPDGLVETSTVDAVGTELSRTASIAGGTSLRTEFIRSYFANGSPQVTETRHRVNGSPTWTDREEFAQAAGATIRKKHTATGPGGTPVVIENTANGVFGKMRFSSPYPIVKN